MRSNEKRRREKINDNSARAEPEGSADMYDRLLRWIRNRRIALMLVVLLLALFFIFLVRPAWSEPRVHVIELGEGGAILSEARRGKVLRH